MKKLLAILLTGVIAVTCCACGNNAAKEGSADANAEKFDSMHIEKVADYLYSMEMADYDYDAVEPVLAEKYKSKGGCASVVNGTLYGRNLDWTYDDSAYFVIKTPATEERHAVLGVTGLPGELTADMVDSREWSDLYDMLPFVLLDGVNDQGLAANVLVLPEGVVDYTTGSNPEGEDMCSLRLVRTVLDYCSNVDEAIELIKSKNIYAPHSDSMDSEVHWRIADANKSVVIEFVNNELKVVEDKPVVTNFYLYDYDGKTMPAVPEGIERYNILMDNYDMGSTKEGMIELMKSVKFSKSYDLGTVPFWYSEQAIPDGCTSADYGDPDLSDGDLSKAGPWEDLIGTALSNFEKGRAKAGDGCAWITCYTAVYDLANKTLTVIPQETDEEYDFSL